METPQHQSVLTIKLHLREPIKLTLDEARIVRQELDKWITPSVCPDDPKEQKLMRDFAKAEQEARFKAHVEQDEHERWLQLNAEHLKAAGIQ